MWNFQMWWFFNSHLAWIAKRVLYMVETVAPTMPNIWNALKSIHKGMASVWESGTVLPMMNSTIPLRPTNRSPAAIPHTNIENGSPDLNHLALNRTKEHPNIVKEEQNIPMTSAVVVNHSGWVPSNGLMDIAKMVHMSKHKTCVGLWRLTRTCLHKQSQNNPLTQQVWVVVFDYLFPPTCSSFSAWLLHNLQFEWTFVNQFLFQFPIDQSTICGGVLSSKLLKGCLWVVCNWGYKWVEFDYNYWKRLSGCIVAGKNCKVNDVGRVRNSIPHWEPVFLNAALH